MPPREVPKKIITDDIFASNAQYPEGDNPIVAISSGPGMIAAGEKDAQWRNQDGYFIGTFPRIPPHALHSLFQHTSKRVQAALSAHDLANGELGYGADSGCAALICLVQDQQIIIGNAGDCFATLMYKKNGRYVAKRLTRPHRADLETEQHRIQQISTLKISKPTQGCASPRICLNELNAKSNRGLMLTRGFGASAYAPGFTEQPDIIRFQLNKIEDLTDAFIVTGSDGFSDYVSDEELEDFFNDNPQLSLPEKAQALRKKAYLEKGSHDNITVGVNTLHEGLGIGIFDGFGHWGRVAANAATEYFTLIKQIAASLSILKGNYNTTLKRSLKKLERKLKVELVFDLSVKSENLQQHPCMQLALATKNMLNVVMDSNKHDSEKMLAVHCYHMLYAKVPRWKKYQRLLFILTCTLIGMIAGALVGGLLSAPFFGAAAPLGAMKGASIGFGVAMGTACFSTGIYHLYNNTPLVAAAAAINDVVDYPRIQHSY